MPRQQWGTAVHLSGGVWNTLCRPGRDRGRYTVATTDERRVTCRACLAIIARRAAPTANAKQEKTR